MLRGLTRLMLDYTLVVFNDGWIAELDLLNASLKRFTVNKFSIRLKY